MDISLFDYHLPVRFIAKFPSEKRDGSNLLVFNRKTENIIFDKFGNIINFLNEDNLLVANNVRVIPARLFGRKKTGGKVELLLLKPKSNFVWEVITKSSKPLKIGDEIFLKDLKCKIEDKNLAEFNIKLDFNVLEEIDSYMPLPPYLKREASDMDRERYQTVYSDSTKKGAIASPTAGLHFTEKLLKDLNTKGIKTAYITLYVGIGTFSPVRCEDITKHEMHLETYEISNSSANIINSAMRNGKKITAVGTTSVRALEDNFLKFGEIKEGKFSTDIFIYPGFSFSVTDSLITNFHLPRSTLLMLVSAFAGREKILKCYEEAKNKDFRFFSYGDSMLIL